MVDAQLPDHVAPRRRDGRREILLHRSMAVIGDDRIEIKSARSTIILPIVGILISAALGATLVVQEGQLPLWLLVTTLFFCLLVAPLSIMTLVSSFIGADVVVDRRKGSATWQQGYLGMGIGTNELVPFEKIVEIEVTIEGDQPDRWRDEADSFRQFALWLNKKSGKRLRITNVPVPAHDATDGMDRVLAVGQAIGAMTGAPVKIPESWELVEIDASTGKVIVKSATTGKDDGDDDLDDVEYEEGYEDEDGEWDGDEEFDEDDDEGDTDAPST